MGHIVIGAYKPNAGQSEALSNILETHVEILRAEGLATQRPHMLMQAKDGTFVELFEWVSADSRELAIANPIIGEIWTKMDKICTYIPASRISELDNLFSELIARN